MSYDAILARSPSIIYQPGGVAGGLVVTSWTQVQKYIAARSGSVIVYVDDSITSPAPVPSATGITACFGRVELRPYAVDGTTFVVLEIEDGATLQDLYAVRAMELRCNCQSATPSLTWTITSTGGDLNLFDFASLTNSSTATNPAISIPAGKQFFLLSTTSFIILHAPAVPLVVIPATAVFNLEVFDGTGVPSGLVSGAGSFSLVYDNASSALFPTPQVPPTQPALTGQYLPTNLDSLFPSPGSQLQATWFIDPANSTGNASDFNSGIDAAHPVLTYQNGVAKKWNTYSPLLRQNTTLTWLSSQPVGGADPVVFTPTLVDAVAVLQGQLTAAQQIGAGSLASVTPKNRATPQLLQADLGFAAPIGTLIQNITVGKSSFAEVYKNVSGTVFALTQPQVPAVGSGPWPFDFTSSTAEVDTWANGDSFVAYSPTQIDLVQVEPIAAEFVAPNFPQPLQVYHLTLAPADGVTGDTNVIVGANVALVESIFNSVPMWQQPANDLPPALVNCFFNAGLLGTSDANSDGEMFAGACIVNVNVGTSIVPWSLMNDAIVDTTAVAGLGAIFSCAYAFEPIGFFYIAGEAIVVGPAANFNQVVMWGPGTLDIGGSTRLFYSGAVGAAVATFQNTGGLQLNGQSSANSFNPTTGLFTSLIPLTPANLDLAFGSGGFGGLALNLGGASISNQAQP